MKSYNIYALGLPVSHNKYKQGPKMSFSYCQETFRSKWRVGLASSNQKFPWCIKVDQIIGQTCSKLVTISSPQFALLTLSIPSGLAIRSIVSDHMGQKGTICWIFLYFKRFAELFPTPKTPVVLAFAWNVATVKIKWVILISSLGVFHRVGCIHVWCIWVSAGNESTSIIFLLILRNL